MGRRVCGQAAGAEASLGAFTAAGVAVAAGVAGMEVAAMGAGVVMAAAVDVNHFKDLAGYAKS